MAASSVEDARKKAVEREGAFVFVCCVVCFVVLCVACGYRSLIKSIFFVIKNISSVCSVFILVVLHQYLVWA